MIKTVAKVGIYLGIKKFL